MVKTFQKFLIKKNKKFSLTPKIQNTLEGMDSNALIQSIIHSEEYNYDESITKKATEILEKRGIIITAEDYKSKEKINLYSWVFTIFINVFGIAIALLLLLNWSYLLGIIMFLVQGIILIYFYSRDENNSNS